MNDNVIDVAKNMRRDFSAGHIEDAISGLVCIMDVRDAQVQAYQLEIDEIKQEISNATVDLNLRLAEALKKAEAVSAEYDEFVFEAEVKLKYIVSESKAKISHMGIEVQYVKPSRKVNMAMFDGYAVAHPEAAVLIEETPSSPRFLDKRAEFRKKAQK